MANKKINDLPLIGAVVDTLQFETDISGSIENKVTWAQLKADAILGIESSIVLVGTGGDYDTVSDASIAGESYMELISNVTETVASITLPDSNVFLRIPPTLVWDCATNQTQVVMGGNSRKFHIFGDGAVTWRTTTTNTSFIDVAATTSTVFKMTDCLYTNLSSVDDCPLTNGCIEQLNRTVNILPNQSNCFLNLSVSGAVCSQLSIIGGGANCDLVIQHNNNYGSFENLKFSGTFGTSLAVIDVDTDQSIYDRIYIDHTTGPFKISATGSFRNIYDVSDNGVQIAALDLDFTAIENFRSETNGILNVNRQFIRVENVSVNEMTTSTANELRMVKCAVNQPLTLNGNRVIMNSCTCNDDFTNNGERNKIVNCDLLEDTTVSATSNNTRFNMCRFGDPGGGQTVTITSGASDTNISNSDVPDLVTSIVDNGTDTVLSNVGEL